MPRCASNALSAPGWSACCATARVRPWRWSASSSSATTSHDQLVYRFPKPQPDGRTELRLSPLELLERLAALIPPPRLHRHRYHGRLTLCRRFRPSPCPTHYGGRWATMPSADCCAITPRRYHRVRCPNRGRVRWVLHAFRRGPQSVSHGNHSGLRVRWLVHAFRPGPQFDSHSRTGRTLHSSPRIRTCAFGAQPPHLPHPPDPWASLYGANSPAD